MSDTVQKMAEHPEHLTCFHPECRRRPLMQDWAGWRWCWRHAWTMGWRPFGCGR